jgi:hypothetical protein
VSQSSGTGYWHLLQTGFKPKTLVYAAMTWCFRRRQKLFRALDIMIQCLKLTLTFSAFSTMVVSSRIGFLNLDSDIFQYLIK